MDRPFGWLARFCLRYFANRFKKNAVREFVRIARAGLRAVRYVASIIPVERERSSMKNIKLTHHPNSMVYLFIALNK